MSHSSLRRWVAFFVQIHKSLCTNRVDFHTRIVYIRTIERNRKGAFEMKKLLDTYLNGLGLTRNQVSKKTGISATTLQRSSGKDAFTINPRVMWAISLMTDKTPGQTFDEIIELEKDTEMTTDEIVLLMNNTFKKLGVDPLITTEDMGDDEQVVVELDLKSDDDPVRFVINGFVDDATRQNVLSDLSYVMDDYDHEKEDGLYPTYRDSEEPKELVEGEYMAVSEESSKYLADLSHRIDKMK